MRTKDDPYGEQLLAQLKRRAATAEIIERDDGYIDTGSFPGSYFREYNEWWPLERRAIQYVSGRVLDIGCGAGRHSLYLQQQGFDVTGIDASPGAVTVCKSRGLKKVLVRPINDVGKFKAGAFDTVLMFGNNFGLFGTPQRAKQLLEKLYRITSADARIIAGSLNPYKTSNPHHLGYHRLNQKRGRLPGQIRMRVRFEVAKGPWFDCLFLSPEEMKALLSNTDWEIDRFLEPDAGNYFAIIRKKKAQSSTDYVPSVHSSLREEA